MKKSYPPSRKTPSVLRHAQEGERSRTISSSMNAKNISASEGFRSRLSAKHETPNARSRELHFPYAYFQGNIVKTEDAKVSIMTNALQYGTAVFGGIRGYFRQEDNSIAVFRLDDHVKRLLKSVNILGCGIDADHEKIKKIILDLIIRNAPKQDIYLRPLAYVGHTALGPNLANTNLDLAIYMIPLGEYLPVDKGLRAKVTSWIRISDNAIPTRAKISGGYVNSALARKEAADGGFDEAIMLNSAGHVAEGSAENLFLVRDGKLITPSLSEGILEGITRRSVITIAADLGIEVSERPIERSELYAADEVFFSGTGCQVAWVREIDGRVIGSGEIGGVSADIQRKFFSAVRGKDAKYSKWNTLVNIE